MPAPEPAPVAVPTPISAPSYRKPLLNGLSSIALAATVPVTAPAPVSYRNHI